MISTPRSALSAWLLGLALAGGSAPHAVAAVDYPTHQVRLVVPSTPGGAIDNIARIVAPRLAAKWGQPVVIDNRAGAGGIIGTESVAKAAPDGHTLLMVTTGFVTNPMMYSHLPYKAPADFTPIIMAGITPNVLVAHPSLGVASVRELIAVAKARPGTLNFGSSGVGSAGHLQMLLFQQLTGVEMTHIPYSGAGAATTAILAGQTQLLSTSVSAVRAYIDRRSLIPLAVMATQRSESLPNVPTLVEAGVAGFSTDGWYGLIGPKGMKPELVDKLYKDVLEVIHTPEVVAQLKGAGFEPGGMAPDAFTKYLNNEVATWEKALKDAPRQDLAK